MVKIHRISMYHFLQSVSRTSKDEQKFIIIHSNWLLNKCIKKAVNYIFSFGCFEKTRFKNLEKMACESYCEAHM